MARSLEQKYDQIDLIRLRGHANEESLIAISTALHGQMPIIDDGGIKAKRMSYQIRIIFDVINGKAKMWSRVDNYPTRVGVNSSRTIDGTL